MKRSLSQKIYRGWIKSCSTDKLPKDRTELILIGVKIIGYDATSEEFTVEVSEDVMLKLDPLWGRFIWGLE
jgi:hypothetical protein